MTRNQSTPAPDIQLPSLPEVCLRALEACRRDDNYRQISAIIASDTGLVARVLALANSALYGRPGEIKSVEQALLRLGTHRVHTLIMTAALRQLLYDLGADQWQQLRDFWRHSLTTALTARALATLTRYPEPDEAFLLGMVHNVGELIALKTKDELLRQHYLHHQADIGANLVDAWGLGPMAADAMRYQQTPPAEIQDASHLVKLINLATRLALSDAAGIAAAVTVFDLGEELTREIKIRIDREVEALAVSLKIPLDRDYDVNETQTRLRNSLIRHALTDQALNLAALDDDLRGLLSSAVSGLTLVTGLPVLSFAATDEGLTLLACSHGPLPAMTIACTPTHSVLSRAYAERRTVALGDGGGSEDDATVLDRQLLNLLGTPSLTALPVVCHAGCAGLLVLGGNGGDTPVTELAELFSQQLAYRIDNLLPGHSGQGDDWQQQLERDQLRRQIHEISNPLTLVRQYIHQLRSKLDDHTPLEAGEVTGELDLIRDELDRASKLLLQIGRHSDGTEASEGPACVNDELEAMHELFADTLFSDGTRQQTLTLCPESTWVSCSRATLRQLIINLVKNSAEAVPQGGKVMVRTAAPVWQNGRHWVELAIEDDGPGLPAEVQQRLFQPVTSSKGSGHSGLGLSIVKQLIDDMEAIISCRTGSSGTLFRVLLPTAADGNQNQPIN